MPLVFVEDLILALIHSSEFAILTVGPKEPQNRINLRHILSYLTNSLLVTGFLLETNCQLLNCHSTVFLSTKFWILLQTTLLFTTKRSQECVIVIQNVSAIVLGNFILYEVLFFLLFTLLSTDC